MNIERILIIVGSIGSVIGGAWAVDEWLLPKISPGISLFIGNYPWIGWSALFMFIGSVAFLVGRRIERRRKPPFIDSQPPPIVPAIPKGARRVETVVDYPRPGATRTTVTIDYFDGLPNTPDVQRRNLFQKADNLYVNHKYEEAIQLFRELLVDPYSLDEEIALLILIGNCNKNLSKLEAAENYYENALSKARIHDNQAAEAAALTGLSTIHITKGILDKALKYNIQALGIHNQINNRLGQASNLGNIGIVYRKIGDLDKASQHFRQAFKIQQQIGDFEGAASSLGELGNVYMANEEFDKAFEQYKQALNIDRKIGDIQGQATGMTGLGIFYSMKGEFDTALQYFQQALNIYERIGNKQGEAGNLCNIGIIYLERGQLDKALHQFQKSLKIHKKIGDRHGEASSLGNIGILYETKDELDKALKQYQLAIKIFEDISEVQNVEVTKKRIDNIQSWLNRTKPR